MLSEDACTESHVGNEGVECGPSPLLAARLASERDVPELSSRGLVRHGRHDASRDLRLGDEAQMLVDLGRHLFVDRGLLPQRAKARDDCTNAHGNLRCEDQSSVAGLRPTFCMAATSRSQLDSWVASWRRPAAVSL